MALKRVALQMVRLSRENGHRLAHLLSRLLPLETLPKRATLKIVRLSSIWIANRPSVNQAVNVLLNHFPRVKARLERLGYSTGQTAPQPPSAEQDVPMSSEVRAIYLDLVNRIKESNARKNVENDP